MNDDRAELLIPLLLQELPTPGEFRRAVESLSPEQRRFAESFRRMQLESTLFAVAVIQIKPQLEAVLNLPPNSLTKEILLTQRLMALFIDHQVPADLMSFDGQTDSPDALTVAKKVDRVKQHVESLQEMLEIVHNESRKERLRQEEQEQEREKKKVRASGHVVVTCGSASNSEAHQAFNLGGPESGAHFHCHYISLANGLIPFVNRYSKEGRSKHSSAI